MSPAKLEAAPSDAVSPSGHEEPQQQPGDVPTTGIGQLLRAEFERTLRDEARSDGPSPLSETDGREVPSGGENEAGETSPNRVDAALVEGDPRTYDSELQQEVTSLQAKSAADRHVIESLVERGLQDRDQIDHLRLALTTSRQIGAAIGIVMATYGVDQKQAFDLLSSVGHKLQRKVRDVAADVLETRTLGS